MFCLFRSGLLSVVHLSLFVHLIFQLSKETCAISEEHFKRVHGVVSADVGIEDWNNDVSLRLFEIREKYGSPLSTMEKNEKRILQRNAILAYQKAQKDQEREEAESKLPRKKHNEQFCTNKGCTIKGLKVSLTQEGLIFCKDCPDPRIEGSYIPVWNSHFNPPTFTVNAALVYAVPNDGSTEVRNPEDVLRRIALVVRGGVSLVHKIRVAQDAGARAVIIINNDCVVNSAWLRCENEVAAQAEGRGFARDDPKSEWENIRIPAVIISKENGKRIHDMMDLASVDAFGGVHFYDRLLNGE
jgi:hypothetical protein